MDLQMQEGKIVEKITQGNVEELDAEGRFVVPAGIDPHARLGTQVARLAGIYSKEWIAEKISQEYLQAGYTFAASADVALNDAISSAHFLQQVKGIDSGLLLSVGSLWMLEVDFKQNNVEDIAGTFAYFANKLHTLNFQVTRPFAGEYWHWGEANASLTDPVKHFEISPEKVITESLKAVKKAGFSGKCFVDLACNKQGDNFSALQAHLKRLDPEKLPYHLIQAQLHVQSTSSDGGNAFANLLAQHPWLSADAGCGSLKGTGVIATTSRDAIAQAKTSLRGTFELDQDIGVGLNDWNLHNKQEGQIWLAAMELLLAGASNRVPVAFSLDSPNLGLPRHFGQILALLANKSLRDKQSLAIAGSHFKQSTLKDVATELSLQDLVQITRLAPARVLGIEGYKGHLGPGADADACIFDLKQGDPITEASLTQAWTTIKSGQVVWKNKTLRPLPASRLFASKINSNIATEDLIKKRDKWFQKYSSISMESLHNPNQEHIVQV